MAKAKTKKAAKSGSVLTIVDPTSGELAPAEYPFLTKSVIKNAGTRNGFRQKLVVLSEEIGPMWVKCRPMPTSVLVDIEELQVKQGDGSPPAIRAILSGIQKCLLDPNSSSDNLMPMFTIEEIAEAIPAECLVNLLEVLSSAEKKVSETAPEQLLSSDSQDNAEPGISGE